MDKSSFFTYMLIAMAAITGLIYAEAHVGLITKSAPDWLMILLAIGDGAAGAWVAYLCLPKKKHEPTN